MYLKHNACVHTECFILQEKTQNISSFFNIAQLHGIARLCHPGGLMNMVSLSRFHVLSVKWRISV